MSTLRKPPRGALRIFARLPLWLYRGRLGWLLGRRFLLLRHTGRTTGRPREVLLEVVHHDRDTDSYFVASAWGERAQWLRNIRANPAVGVVVGRRRVEARAQRVTTEEAASMLGEYARSHRLAMRGLRRLFGSDDIAELANVIPIVELRVANRL